MFDDRGASCCELHAPSCIPINKKQTDDDAARLASHHSPLVARLAPPEEEERRREGARYEDMRDDDVFFIYLIFGIPGKRGGETSPLEVSAVASNPPSMSIFIYTRNPTTLFLKHNTDTHAHERT